MTTRKYVTADLHLGQGPGIIKHRPQYRDYRDHDDDIIREINRVVPPTSTLILAGDIGIKEEGWERLQELQCRNIIVVPGNHCGERAPIRLPDNIRIQGAYVTCLPTTRIAAVITHIQVHPQCLDRWHINIHGHLHDRVIVDDPRYYGVSLEQSKYSPVCLEDIASHYRYLARWQKGPVDPRLQWPDWIIDRAFKVPN